MANLLDRAADGVHVVGGDRDGVVSQEVPLMGTARVVPTVREDSVQTAASLLGELVEEWADRSVDVCKKNQPRRKQAVVKIVGSVHDKEAREVDVGKIPKRD